MDTLTISKKLIAVGFKQEQAEAVAITIKEEVKARNDELMTKNDGKRLEWMLGLIILVSGAGFGYMVSLLNTLISKI